jgi:hypothetical protein
LTPRQREHERIKDRSKGGTRARICIWIDVENIVAAKAEAERLRKPLATLIDDILRTRLIR